MGFANIRLNENSFVEGVLYDVDDLTNLDKWEGYPKHYNKKIVKVNGVDAIVYIASEDWIAENLKATKEYKNIILDGKKYLSEEYYNKLNEIIKT
jgi:hypothetical protein